MDPLAAKATDSALKFAIERVSHLLGEAKERRTADLERCSKYLEATMAAIEGLEGEYDQILVAACCANEDPAKLEELRQRVETYLRIERLRPRLLEAIAGLDFYCNEFTKNAASFLQWPWKARNRERAAKEFTKLLISLRDYSRKLEEEGLRHRAAGSGVGIAALNSILQHLERPVGLRSGTLEQMAREYQSHRNHEPMFDRTRTIRRMVEQLRQAFR